MSKMTNGEKLQERIKERLKDIKARLSNLSPHIYNSLRKLNDFFGHQSPSRKREALTREEVRKIIKSTNSLRDKLIISLLYYCGLRSGEVSEIKLDQVNRRERSIEVRGSMGKQTRKIPYPRKLDRLFRRYLKRRSDKVNNAVDLAKRLKDVPVPLFVSERGRKLRRSSIWRIVHEGAKSAEVQEVIRERPRGDLIWKINPWLLRCSFVKHALENRVPVRVIQRIQRLEEDRPSYPISPYFFVSKPGGKLSTQRMGEIVREFAEEAGIHKREGLKGRIA